ncbi:uncharacterized protein H6S33_001367 [Morchella sextelata]|uniref:uncharacterized protein n=1 Tax=Morchella sextelata TaxID=1174677 RepID=UPI001D056550|nr:uncharacterized protein H6S33_001367 [Morchella sextelata]KAH0609139.1 hypothetical protein H6S33_001367 [Morchella sextelata]
MPEDIGLSGLYKSITHLIQLNAQIVSSIYTYAAHLKRVPPDILILLDELRALEKTLMILQLRNLLTSPISVTSAIQSRLQQLNDLNRKSSECLQNLTSRLKPLKSPRFAGVLGGTKWLPNMKEALYDHASDVQKQRKFYLSIITFDKESRPNSDSTEDTLPRIPPGATLGDLRVESPILDSLNKGTTQDTGEDENLKQVFSWLRHDDHQRHLDIRQQRIAKTGTWILRDIIFQKWREQRDFRSIVIDHLQSQAYAKNFGIAYIYFSYQDQEQQDPIYVLASLTEQLFRQHPNISKKIEIINNLNKLNTKGQKPSINKLYTILLEASRNFDRTFIVFDALDECDPSRRRFLLPLFKRMGEDCFSIFLTSRPYEDIRDSLRLTMKIEISANREDIGMYIQQRIEEDPRARLLLKQGNFRDQIITHLVDGSRGVFLWARLQLMHICKQTSTEKILFTLEKILDERFSTPERFLDQSYDRAMMNICNQRKSSVNLAAKIFSWLARTRRTLTLDELRIAVAVKPNTYRLSESDLPDRAKLLEVCDSLVTVGEYSNTVRLTHYTVLEYLLRNPILTSSGDPAYELALTCATYLSFDIFHPRVSFKEENESVARLLIKEDDKDILEKDDLGQTALHIAASEGHTDIVQLLLDKGLDPLAPDKEGKTALHGAAFAGHESVVRTLLEYKGNFLALDIKRNEALCWAVSTGYQDIAKDIIENTSATVGDEEWILVPSLVEGNEASVGALPWNHADAQINIHHEPTIEQCRTLALIPYVENIMPTNFEANHWPPQRWNDPERSLSPSFVSSYSTQSCSTPRAPTQTSSSVNLYYKNDEEEFFITEEEDSCSSSSERSSSWGIVHYTNGNNDKGKRKAVDSQASAPKHESASLGVPSKGLDDALGRKRRRKDGGSAPTVTTSLNGISASALCKVERPEGTQS